MGVFMDMSRDIIKLQETFKKLHGSKKDSFAVSLPYYLLTGRKGSNVYSDGVATIVVAQHPHIPDTLLVFPEIGGDGTLTVNILNELSKQHKDVQLARYTDEDFERINRALHKQRSSVIASIKLTPEDIMDWKYPSYILDTKKISRLQTDDSKEKKELSVLRNKFNKVVGDFKEIPLTHPDAIKKMRASILIWAALRINAGAESGYNMREFYDATVKLISALPNSLEGFVVSHNGEPAGFSVWHEAGDTANGLASLSRRSIKGMSEYMMVNTCQKLEARGVDKYNIGGSETKGLDQFKLKFLPAESIQLNSYNVEYKNLIHFGINQCRLIENNND